MAGAERARASRPGIPIRYLLVFWLFVLSGVAFLDRTNLSIAGIQIARDFGIDNTRLGWLQSAFLIGYAGFQVPAGLLARRFGPRRVLSAGVLWWSVFTVLTALAPSRLRGALVLLAAIRLALGAGEAVMYPATSQFVERWFPVEERGMANGIIFGGIGIGSGLTPPIVTAVILHFGWRASFWISAVVGGVGALVWYIAARDEPSELPRVRESELRWIEEGRNDDSRRTAEGAAPPVAWRQIARNGSVWAVSASYFSFGYVAWIFFAWFYIYLAQVRGLNLKASALYAMLPFLAMTVGCLLGGVASDVVARWFGLRAGRCLVPALALASTAVLLVVGSRAQSAAAAAWVLAAGAGVLYIAQSAFWAVTADIVAADVSVVSGIMNMGGQIGGACTASLTPYIAGRLGWNASFATAAGIAVLGAVAWSGVRPRSFRVAPIAASLGGVEPIPQ